MNEARRALLKRRALWGALVASLALNAFFVGLYAAERMRNPTPQRNARVLGFELRWLSGRLPEEGRRSVETALETARPSVQAHLDRIRELRREIRRLAAAPVPDRAEIDRRLALIGVESDAIQEEVQKATYDALLRLSPDLRKDLARE